jgi:hypothetical protein
MKINECWELIENGFRKDNRNTVALQLDWSKRKQLWLGIDPDRKTFFALEINEIQFNDFDEDLLPEYNSFNVTTSRSNDKYFLRISLKAPEMTDLFKLLIQDILNVAEIMLEEQVADSIIRRIQTWDTFFEKGKIEYLSREKLIGLWGELIFLEKVLISHPEIAYQVIKSWQNESGIEKDFRFGNCSFEIKSTIQKKKPRLKISSELQLFNESSNPLYLIGIVLSPDSKDKRKISEIISSCRAKLQEPLAIRIFDLKLFEAGYVAEHENYYSSYKFGPIQFFCFNVTDNFPSLIKGKINPILSHVSYEIDPFQCREWSIELPGVIDGIRK